MNKLSLVFINLTIAAITHVIIAIYYGMSPAIDPSLSNSETKIEMFKLVYPNILSILIVFGILFFVNKYTYGVKKSVYIYLFSVVLSLFVISFWATKYYAAIIHLRERIPVIPAL